MDLRHSGTTYIQETLTFLLIENLCFSTYMDSKSPGLSSRVVQYHNASEYKPTHQIKYDKAGIFPIVHLFKKDIPVVSPKPKRVTVRLANPGKHLFNDKKLICNECASLVYLSIFSAHIM